MNRIQQNNSMPQQHNHVYNGEKLLLGLRDHNNFFDDLVDMIPSKLYVADNTGDEKYNPKYRKGQHKESKEARRARNKASKKLKFDPNLSESTRQTQCRKEKEEYEIDDGDDGEGKDLSLEMDDCHSEGKDIDTEQDIEGEKEEQSSIKSLRNQSLIEGLRDKLHAKLRKKRSQRPDGGSGSNENSALISKRAARRAEKHRRIEIAKRRNSGGSAQTSLRLDKKRKKKIDDGNNLKEKDLGGRKLLLNTSSINNPNDDLVAIDFGGITGLNNKLDKPNYINCNKNLKNMEKKKSLERLLSEAEIKSKRLKQLKASADLEDKTKAKTIEWRDTLKTACGDIPKDDTNLLKKAIKRKGRKKAKSEKSWKARTEKLKDKLHERQKIRQHNINQRKLGGSAGANLSRKRMVDEDQKKDVGGTGSSVGEKKRPRLGPYSGMPRAGFEGKKQDFINKSGKGGGG